MNINSNLFYIKKYKYRLSFIAIFILIVLGLYIYAYTLAQKNRNGYCFKQQRYVSKQEIIDKMIAYSLTK
ncbi:MAG: hypothetical protein RLZZ210_257, partial [Pseudomonadota bacterium]